MELNVDKIKKELSRIGWSYGRLAKECGFKKRQNIFYYLNSKSISGADMFGKALQIDPKDLIK